MKPSQQNYANLISLWKRYGAIALSSEQPLLWRTRGWPYRSWLENPDALTHPNAVKPLLENLVRTAPGTSFSLCKSTEIVQHETLAAMESILTKSGFQHTFSQVAMHLPLTHWNGSKTHNGLHSTKIKNTKKVVEWASIGSDAFGYEIDPTIIENVIKNSGISCLLFELEGIAVATVLLYQTGSIMGVHQVAVRPEFQGYGIARKLMVGLINYCKEQQIDEVTLQASNAGKHLYSSLGFLDLFDIHNYTASHLM